MTYSAILTKLSKTYPEALTNPEKYLGPNFEQVLDFWKHIEGLSNQDKVEMEDRYYALDFNVRDSAIDFAINAAYEVVGREFGINAAYEVVGREFGDEAWNAAWDVTGLRVFGDATLELVGNVNNKVAYDLIMQNSNKSETVSPELIKQLKIYQENLKQTAADWFDASLTAKNAGLQELAADFKMKEIECKKIIAIIAQTVADFTSPLASEYIRNTKIVEIPTPIISKTHKKCSDYLKQPDVLTNPEKYLGPNYLKVLEFWKFIDTLSYQERKKISDLFWALDDNVRDFAINTARDAAWVVVGWAFKNAAWNAALGVTGWVVFGNATLELIGDVDNKVAYDLIMSHKKS